MKWSDICKQITADTLSFIPRKEQAKVINLDEYRKRKRLAAKRQEWFLQLVARPDGPGPGGVA